MVVGCFCFESLLTGINKMVCVSFTVLGLTCLLILIVLVYYQQLTSSSTTVVEVKEEEDIEAPANTRVISVTEEVGHLMPS